MLITLIRWWIAIRLECLRLHNIIIIASKLCTVLKPSIQPIASQLLVLVYTDIIFVGGSMVGATQSMPFFFLSRNTKLFSGLKLIIYNQATIRQCIDAHCCTL